MATVRDFEELMIFQKARELSKKIYPITKRREYKYDSRFVQQIRAAAGSIMDNIAEPTNEANAESSLLELCWARRRKTLVNFLYIAKGSCGEVRSQLIRANDVGYLTPDEYNELYNDCRKLSAAIMNFIKEIRASEYTGAKFQSSKSSTVQED